MSNSVSALGLAVSAAFMRVPPLTQADRIGVSGLGDEQWKKLVHMLQERKPEPNEHLSVSIFLSLGLSIQEPLNI